MSPPPVSVVIPTLDAGRRFREVLEGLRAQEGNFELEILVLDSGSSDGTVELAESYRAKVHRVAPLEFNHGATRDLGISLSRGEYVALLVQDAVPADGQWLAAMVEDLENDEEVTGVYSRQIPREESSALTRVLVNGWATASPVRREQFADPEKYPSLPLEERWRLATFDNVSSCVRRRVWERIPFGRTNFGEDLRWGKKTIEAGHKLVYEPCSAVFHSHERGALYDLRRHYANQSVLLDLFGLKLTPNLGSLLLNTLRSAGYLYRQLRRDEWADEGGLKLAVMAMKHAVPSQLGSYLGVKKQCIEYLNPRVSDALTRFLGKGI